MPWRAKQLFVGWLEGSEAESFCFFREGEEKNGLLHSDNDEVLSVPVKKASIPKFVGCPATTGETGRDPHVLHWGLVVSLDGPKEVFKLSNILIRAVRWGAEHIPVWGGNDRVSRIV